MKIRNYLIPVFSVLALASCNYEQINTNIYGVTEEGMKTGGLLYGAPFMDMQKLVIPIGSPTESTGPGNDLANTDIMSAGNYIGYWGMNNNWNFNTEATWNFTDARMSYAYQNFYSKLFRAWNDIYKHTKDSEDPADKEVRAVANIVKAVAWLRATDVFGPIVYTNAGNGDIAPKLDSQEAVYKAMLADLKDASELLVNTASKVLPSYDVIYNGNASNWVRLANSLMLRIAVRVHFKDEALRLSQNRVEMASFVSSPIEVIWIFLKKGVYKLTFEGFILSNFFFRCHKPPKRLLLQDYVQWPAGRTQFQPS